ncbi:MAG: phosphotransferase, partial [Syntrophaceae bacterium]|nr:phosphotransferase [Syntrophaceae bacterium]
RGVICDLRGILKQPGVRRCLFTGIYLVERHFLRRLTLGKVESVVPVFAAMIRETQDAVASVVIDAGGWEDIGDPEAYSRIVASIAGDDQEAAAFVREALELAAGKEVRLAPIGKGGSDRDYYRVGAQGKPTVLMRYGRLYEENDRYAALSGFLLGIDVMVPMIYCHDPQRRLILMEDLGDEDLYTLREAPWAQRRSFYEKTLLQAVRLHTFPLYRIPSDLKLMAGFDSSLYRWERDYFLEECVRSACGIALRPGEAEDLEAELATLAERLLAMPQALIHRDLQSQNVMIRRGEPILIDFQGMRYGNPFYDLGSLLWDPYVAFPEGARETLLRFYYGAAGATISWEAFQKHFCLASIQRLMQALGAYGCLGLKRGKPHFLAHIDPALVNLAAVAAEAGGLPRLAALVARCRAAHRHS